MICLKSMDKKKINKTNVLVKILKLTNQMISKASNYTQKVDDQRILKTPKVENLTPYICSNIPQMLTPKFRLILNSSWSNNKSTRETLKEICESDIHGKLIEQRI